MKYHKLTWKEYEKESELKLQAQKERIRQLESEIKRLNDKYDFQLLVKRNEELERQIECWKIKNDNLRWDNVSKQIEKLEAENKKMKKALEDLAEPLTRQDYTVARYDEIVRQIANEALSESEK